MSSTIFTPVETLPDFPKSKNFCQTIEEFTTTLERLLKSAWGKDWGVFTEEYTSYSDPEKIVLPQIVFHLVKRRPFKELSPLKRRLMANYPDSEYKGYNVDIFKNWYECEVQFRCFARTNKEVRSLSVKLEDFITSYTGFFKERGLGEINFMEEKEPEKLSDSAGRVPCRILTYRFRVEHTTIIRQKTLEEVLIGADVPSPDELTS
jgi:hypothetical protein